MRNLQGNIFFGCLLLAGVSGEGWRFPDRRSVRIDTKVRFEDDHARPAAARRDNSDKHAHPNPQDDELPFKEPTNTEGFYNRPPGSGRYPVRVEASQLPYRVNPHAIMPVTSYGHRRQLSNDAAGTLDSFRYCKCVTTPDCNPVPDTNHACGSGEFLCCYKKGTKLDSKNSEFFNEIEDERPVLYPNREVPGGAFPPPPMEVHHRVVGLQRPTAGGAGAGQSLLVGPAGPTGHIGPTKPSDNYPVLVGPDGPTGVIGPAPLRNDKDIKASAAAQYGVLVGPGGPTGVIGPNRGQFGAAGPTGVIGLNRGVLVGPGGPTGMIGPVYNRQSNPGILVGPGGPTGMIGPAYNRQSNPGILVGPGGPTGIIGPGRQLLVGPGGPTGYIGPRRPYDFSGLSNKEAIHSILNMPNRTIIITRSQKTDPITEQKPRKADCTHDKKKQVKRETTEVKELQQKTTTELNLVMRTQAVTPVTVIHKVRKPRGIITGFLLPKLLKKEKSVTEVEGDSTFKMVSIGLLLKVLDFLFLV